jgi:hypothetical protein
MGGVVPVCTSGPTHQLTNYSCGVTLCGMTLMILPCAP